MLFVLSPIVNLSQETTNQFLKGKCRDIVSLELGNNEIHSH